MASWPTYTRKICLRNGKRLAECTLARIPVFHSQQIMESLTGRVKVEHLSENIFGELLPSPMYSALKRLVVTLPGLFLLLEIFLILLRWKEQPLNFQPVPHF